MTKPAFRRACLLAEAALKPSRPVKGAPAEIICTKTNDEVVAQLRSSELDQLWEKTCCGLAGIYKVPALEIAKVGYGWSNQRLVP